MLPRSFFFSIIPVLFLLHPTNSQEPTVGPLAPLSIASKSAYSLARPCAAGCLVFNGVWACGVNAGYYDLGIELGCGCSPTNNCYCSSGSQEHATSYIQSCVSAGCVKFGDVENDLSGALGLYSGYCATANVAQDTSTKAAVKTTTGVGLVQTTESVPGATGATAPAQETGTTNPTSSSPAQATTSPPGDEKDEGLSKSDIIALGTGLGIGVPSLIIGVLALVFQLKKRRAAAAEHAGLIAPTESYQQINTATPTPAATPPPPPPPQPWSGYGQEQGQVHEVGGKTHYTQAYELGNEQGHGQAFEMGTHSDTRGWR